MLSVAVAICAGVEWLHFVASTSSDSHWVWPPACRLTGGRTVDRIEYYVIAVMLESVNCEVGLWGERTTYLQPNHTFAHCSRARRK